MGDDTHGHVDDIARFVSRNTIMAAVEKNKRDKNYKNPNENFKILTKVKMKTAKNSKLLKYLCHHLFI